MTKKQEEAIRICEERIIKPFYEFPNPTSIELKDIDVEEIETVLNMLKEKDKQIEEVLNLIFEFGQIDGDHHKAWVIDQIVKILTKDKYDEWVRNYVYDEETGDTYSWYKGIAP